MSHANMKAPAPATSPQPAIRQNSRALDDTELKYLIERSRNLSRELMICEGDLEGRDAELAADALDNYHDALLDRRVCRHYGSVERVIIATYAEEDAEALRSRAARGLGLMYGPNMSEFISRALALYADDLSEPPAPAQKAA
jgi:hypothetical protein